jgi:hypothetical protein
MRKIGLAPSYAQMSLALVVLLLSSGLLTGDVGAEERIYPIKIGVLTASWGPTPQVVGLRETVCWSWATVRTSNSFSASASPKEI